MLGLSSGHTIPELPGSNGPAFSRPWDLSHGRRFQALREVRPMKRAGLATLALLSATLAACGGGGDAAPQQATGRLNLALTDAPVDAASAVIIVFTGVELQPASGDRVVFDFPSERQIDLLAFQGGATTDLLQDAVVPAGDYQWMRLKVLAERNLQNGSRVVFPGETYPLYIPSGGESGLKLNRPFRVAAGGVTRLVADFDLRKSIIAPKGQEPNYVLKPVLRLMDELETGTLAGTVDLRALTDSLLEPAAEPRSIGECSAGLYVLEQDTLGVPTAPDDMDGDPADGRDPRRVLPARVGRGERHDVVRDRIDGRRPLYRGRYLPVRGGHRAGRERVRSDGDPGRRVDEVDSRR